MSGQVIAYTGQVVLLQRLCARDLRYPAKTLRASANSGNDERVASWEWRRSVTNSAILVELGTDHGLTVEDCLRDTGIEQLAIKTPGAEVTAAQEMQLVRNIVTLLDDQPGLGLEAGMRTHITTHGVFGLAVLASPTTRAAGEVAMRYFALMTSFSNAWHVYQGDEMFLYVDDSEIPEDIRAFLGERDVAALLTNWFLCFGQPPPVVRAEVAHEQAWRLKPILDQFEIPMVIREHPPQLAVFDTTGFDDPLPQASPLTAALFEEQCADLLARRGLQNGIAGSVREVLLHRVNNRVSQEDVAATLHMSLRTMRRRLADEGTSYRRLCVETYGTLAEELLSTGLTVEDVAYRMGYSGAPSFSNAFKQWRGVSPGRFARNATQRFHSVSGSH